MGWIKIRASLLTSPRLIKMARILKATPEFLAWLGPDADHPVSDAALRRVTLGALCAFWSSAREHGKFISNDLFLSHATLADLDDIADMPGFGEAMRGVDWAIPSDDPLGITLPNFKDYNVPMTGAERQKAYRRRRVTHSDVGHVTTGDAKVTPRGEKSRVDKSRGDKIKKKRNGVTFPAVLDHDTFREKWSEWIAYRAARRLPKLVTQSVNAQLNKLAGWGHDAAIESIDNSIANNWAGVFPPDQKGINLESASDKKKRRESSDYSETDAPRAKII